MIGGIFLSRTRHYFPGNNTPKGFFSYYGYILSQREANKLICIKGGPGTGKSTFLKNVGKQLEVQGMDVDYLHCSADANSLDGILLPEKKIALIDGTSPHVIDPVTPGAVDYIINFGEFWDDSSITDEKDNIITFNENCSRWYRIAYNDLRASKAVLDNLSMIQDEGIELSELYKLAAEIIAKEYKFYDISIKAGHIKKFFATGITPTGCVNYSKSLVKDIDKVYLINVPEGYRNHSFMHVLLEGAIYRGFDAECYYCPMDPEEKIEHLIIPELSLAFLTTNKWHDLEPWDITCEDGKIKDIILIDISDYQSIYFAERQKDLLHQLSKSYAEMMQLALSAFGKAKEAHDLVEKFYIKNMDFSRVDALVEQTVKEILR